MVTILVFLHVADAAKLKTVEPVPLTGYNFNAPIPRLRCYRLSEPMGNHLETSIVTG